MVWKNDSSGQMTWWKNLTKSRSRATKAVTSSHASRDSAHHVDPPYGISSCKRLFVLASVHCAADTVHGSMYRRVPHVRGPVAACRSSDATRLAGLVVRHLDHVHELVLRVALEESLDRSSRSQRIVGPTEQDESVEVLRVLQRRTKQHERRFDLRVVTPPDLDPFGCEPDVRTLQMQEVPLAANARRPCSINWPVHVSITPPGLAFRRSDCDRARRSPAMRGRCLVRSLHPIRREMSECSCTIGVPHPMDQR